MYTHSFTEKLSCGFLWICHLVFTGWFFLCSETFSWSRAKCGWPKTPSVTRNTMRRLLWGWPWDPSLRNTGKRHFPFARNVAGHSMTLTTVLHLHILVHKWLTTDSTQFTVLLFHFQMSKVAALPSPSPPSQVSFREGKPSSF